jgi:prevent-host-death family protein
MKSLKRKSASNRIARSRPEPDGETPRYTATEAQNRFTHLLDAVQAEGTIFITKHDKTRVVMLSIEEFDRLIRPQRERLAALKREYDAMVVGMQTAKQRDAMAAAFSASPKELGEAAVWGARRSTRRHG